MRRTLAAALVVVSKEVVDNLRDRRAVTMALLFPLLGPAVLATMITLVARTAHVAAEGQLELAVAGREHAPNLVAFLEASGARVMAAPPDAAAAVRSGDVDVVVAVPPEFGASLRAGRPAPVRLVVDESRQSAQGAILHARSLLEAYGRQLGVQRLLVRGVDPSLASAIAVETEDLATDESRGALLLAVLPYFVVLAIFAGGMYVAIDTTAGERERQSLEPLLLNPAPRAALVLAKAGAAALFATIALAEALAGFAAVPLALSPERLGFAVRLDPAVLAGVFLFALPLVLFTSALQILVSARARGFKAAQAALSLLMMVPVLPGMMLAFVPVKLAPWMMLVPTLGEQLVISRLLRGEPVAPRLIALGMATTFGWAAVAFAAAVRVFSGEKVVFGR